MKNGWASKALSEVCEIRPPKSEARSKFSGDKLVSFLPMEDLGIDEKFVRATQTKPLSAVAGNYTYFADGDVILAKITPCFENGKLGIAERLTNGIGFGSSEYIVFRPGRTLRKEWLYYFLSREAFRIEGAARMAGAVGHKRVAKDFIEGYPIPIPPLPEQQRIVGILDETFDGIAAAKTNAEKNLQNAGDLFEGYLESIFTQRGNGWVERSVDQLVSEGALYKPFDGNHGEIHPRKADYTESGVPFIMASDLENGGVDAKNCKFISRKLADSLRVGFAKDGDVLISHKGTIGRSAIVSTNEDYIMLTPQVTSYRVKDVSRLFNRYIYYYFMSPTFQREMISAAEGGATRAYIGITKQLTLHFRFPSLKDQRKISTKLDQLDAETRRLESIYRQKLAVLGALQRSLLHQAFTGNL